MESKKSANSASDLEWQKRAFPYMAGIIVVFSVFFLIATGYQLINIQNKIDFRKNDTGQIDSSQTANSGSDTKSELSSKIELETYVIDRRYHQSNMLLISRIWIQYLGFLVGTILVLIGAIFILGKLQEEGSSFDSDMGKVGKFAFNSSSPGLFLSFFGTLIISTTLFYHPVITTEDASLYLDKKYQFDVGKNFSTSPDSTIKSLMIDPDFSKQDSSEIKPLILDL